MGIKADSGGRNASLDDRKRRAAGRGQNASPERRAIQDARGGGERGRGAATSGAFGKQGQANRRGAKLGAGGGGGGADPKSRIVRTRPSRKTH